MRIGRTLPPAAAPIYWRDIVSGLKGLVRGKAELNRFESELKEYFGVRHCFLVSSGKAALTLILRALKDIHPDRDEVLIPAFTCYSVPSAIVRAGLKVRLCDIDPNTMDFNFDDLAHILSKKPFELSAISYQQSNEPSPEDCEPNPKNSISPSNTKNSDRLLAIIPTHLFGLPSDVHRVKKLVNDPEITVVEDAAQTMGAVWKDKRLGTSGDISFFSLGRGKALSTLEGGIILTNRTDIAEKIETRVSRAPCYSAIQVLNLMLKALSLTVCGRPTLFWLPKSFPFLRLGETIYNPHFNIKKMTAFQAGLAHDWVVKIQGLKGDRTRNSRQWVLIAKNASLPCYCSDNGRIPEMLRFPLKIEDNSSRKRILKESEQGGLGIMPSYPDSIDGIAELRERFHGQDFPMAKKIARELVTLPVHPFLSQKDRDQIITVLSQISNNEPS
jgi:dTDP-4-amino-4,6-dideoxygalactose transaminase